MFGPWNPGRVPLSWCFRCFGRVWLRGCWKCLQKVHVNVLLVFSHFKLPILMDNFRKCRDNIILCMPSTYQIHKKNSEYHHIRHIWIYNSHCWWNKSVSLPGKENQKCGSFPASTGAINLCLVNNSEENIVFQTKWLEWCGELWRLSNCSTDFHVWVSGKPLKVYSNHRWDQWTRNCNNCHKFKQIHPFQNGTNKNLLLRSAK